MTLQPSVHLASRAGRMTAAMRALGAPQPPALRIAIVRDGRVLEERLFRAPARISVGSSERATFTIAGPNVPQSLLLFEPRQGGFARGEQLLELGARGRVRIGGVTLLYQMVVPPPAPARPQLPLAVLRKGPLVDWPTTLIAGLAFLLHFGAIGALYSDWVDPVVDDGVVIGAVVDALRAPPAPPLETVHESAPEPSAVVSTGRETPRRRVERGTGRTSSEAGLGRELDQVLMGVLPALGSDAPATRDVLRASEVPTGALDAVAAREDGVSGPDRLALAPAGRPLRLGETGGDLRSLGRTRRERAGDTGRSADVRRPLAATSVPTPGVTGRVDGAARVVAGLRAGFRHCYLRGLDLSPDAEGRVRLTLRVGPNGEVQSVGAAPSGNLPGSMVSCVRARAAGAQFSPPEGGSAVVDVPVIFRNQR